MIRTVSHFFVLLLCLTGLTAQAQSALPDINNCEICASKTGSPKQNYASKNAYYWCLALGSPTTLLKEAELIKKSVKRYLVLPPKTTDAKKLFDHYCAMIAKTNLAYFYEMRAFRILQKTSPDQNIIQGLAEKKQKSLSNRNAVLKIIKASLKTEEEKNPAVKEQRIKYDSFWEAETDRTFKAFQTGKRQNPENMFLDNEAFVLNVLTAAYVGKDFTTLLNDPGIVNYIAECNKPIKHKGWDITRLDSKTYLYRLSPDLYAISKKITSFRDTKVIFNATGQDRYNFIFQYGYAESYRAAYRTYQLYVDGQKVFEGKWKNEKDKDTPPSFGLDIVKKLRKGKVGEIKVIDNLLESKMYGSVKFSLDGFTKAENLGKIPCQK